MQAGDMHLDLRDRTVVQVQEVHLTNPGEPGMVLVTDVTKGFAFLVDPRFLSPRALDPFAVLEWMQRG